MSDLPERLRDDSVGLGLDGLALRDEAADEIDRLREALVKVSTYTDATHKLHPVTSRAAWCQRIATEALKPLPDKTP